MSGGEENHTAEQQPGWGECYKGQGPTVWEGKPYRNILAVPPLLVCPSFFPRAWTPS